MPLVSETEEWKALAAHKSEIENVTMRSMFDSEGGEERFEKFSTKVVGDCQFEMLLDYSKNKMNSDTMEKLYALAKKQGVEDTRDKMFKGEKVNSVEGKPVAHMGLRSPSPKKDIVDLKAKMKQFVEKLVNYDETDNRVQNQHRGEGDCTAPYLRRLWENRVFRLFFEVLEYAGKLIYFAGFCVFGTVNFNSNPGRSLKLKKKS